jgi:hypothetical protein
MIGTRVNEYRYIVNSNEPDMKEHSINLGQRMQNAGNLSSNFRHMNRIIRETVEIEILRSNRKTKDGFFLRISCKPLIFCLKECRLTSL